jgi:exodeoxyribonuclease VII small subunit
MATKKRDGSEPSGYREAISELEGILRELDSNTVDVDVLTTRVARASYLIVWCQERITSTQMTVDDMVARLRDDDDGGSDDEDDE